MAVRTLGELKYAEARPTLVRLSTVDDPFLARAAQRSLASLDEQGDSKEKHESLQRPTAKQLDYDLSLLPRNCGVVAQLSLHKSIGFRMTKDQVGGLFFRGDRPAALFVPRVGRTIELLEQIGNVRIEAVTAGISDDFSHDSAFVLAIVRGRYDRKAFPRDVCRVGLSGRKCRWHRSRAIKVRPSTPTAFGSTCRIRRGAAGQSGVF